MAFGVTSEGFKAKKYADIIEEVGESLLTELNIDINSDPDSVAKILTSIFTLALADEWALPQALQSMFDIDKSEGKHLDDLVGYVGLSRLSSAASSGYEYITSTQEISIPSGTNFKDVSGNNYPSVGTILVTKSSFTDITLKLSSPLAVSDVLSVVINGVTSSSPVLTTVEAALNILVNSINNTPTNLVVATSLEDTGVFYLIIQNDNDLTPSTITNTNNLTTSSITSFGTVAKDVVGAFGVTSNTVTVAPAISGITSVTNRYPFTIGRLLESDIDLRVRHSLSLSTAGAATVEAIRADLLIVDGVTNAFVLENDTLFTDADNIPAKAFLSVVKGGLDQDIGDALWQTKGAGIQTDGDIQVTVVDSQGVNKYVNFSRPLPVYVHVNVDYTLYSEQSTDFPTNGEAQIVEQVLAYGGALSVGTDVIPQRIATQLFNTIGGLGVVNVTVGSTVGPNDPTPTLTSAILPVSQISEADFSNLRITVVEV